MFIVNGKEMDFFILFLIYLAFSLSCMLVAIKFSSQSQECFVRISHHVTQMIGPMVPRQMQVAVQYALHRLIHRRNSFFLALHLLLEVAVYGEYSWEVFPYALELGFTLSNLLLPYTLLFGKMYFFYLCCISDPGIISPSNHKQLLKVYTYDGILYQRARVCSTCKLVKLARSRHCRLCNCCVHRFDHHCVWVNNCIGALNIRYFLFYLVTLSGMAAAVATMTLRFLVRVALMSNLPQAMYVNAEGEDVPVGILFIVQFVKIWHYWNGPVLEWEALAQHASSRTGLTKHRWRYCSKTVPDLSSDLLHVGLHAAHHLPAGRIYCFSFILSDDKSDIK
ncbi:palmitoyltransferase ZDHHC4 isoform X3 [Mobula birostris]|uniref:palmitoyltransferase ZDHHC4 isoform X3 n=1 Tax=Mobula birostris TaxID=1983395 RepID=UPI003B28791C